MLVGVVNGEDVTLDSSLATGSFFSKNVGTWTVSVSGLSLSGADIDNYTLTQPTLTADITKAALTVTADDQEITYGDDLPTFTATPVGLVNGETLDSLGGVAFGGDSQTAVNHGTYTITASGLDDSNYTISYQDGTLTIDKATLTVTADNQEITYGDALPTFTATPAGLVNGDTLDSLGGVAFGGDSQSAVNHGTYTITASGLDDSNYTITYQDGTLTIDKAALTVTADNQEITYGDALPTFTATPVGLVNGDTLDSLGGVAFGGDSQSAVNHGTYTITASGLDDSNYTITYQDGTLTIDKAALTVTGITVDSKVYDGATRRHAPPGQSHAGGRGERRGRDAGQPVWPRAASSARTWGRGR